jgi:hypothetical protein
LRRRIRIPQIRNVAKVPVLAARASKADPLVIGKITTMIMRTNAPASADPSTNSSAKNGVGIRRFDFNVVTGTAPGTVSDATAGAML